ncbi:MAG: HK97 family phage prohead protease [Rhizobiaceae bacterium]|nr:HK97 family phage prohead protease [Rhizobiaceae bacterium]
MLRTMVSPEIKRNRLSIETLTAAGEFTGYATLFGKVDLGKDRVVRGAFRQSLKRRSIKGARMLFQHDPCEPIGVWHEISEDAQGLYVRGRIIADTVKGAEVLSLMRAGAIDGLSIGFRTRKSRTDRKSGIRSILEADLWEISIVTFPMLPQARVRQVKFHRNPGSLSPQTRRQVATRLRRATRILAAT